MKFTMELIPHTPTGKQNVCRECVLQVGEFMCLDRSYCRVKETGKTWAKFNYPPKVTTDKKE